MEIEQIAKYVPVGSWNVVESWRAEQHFVIRCSEDELKILRHAVSYTLDNDAAIRPGDTINVIRTLLTRF
jgi:hypothetical protein